MQRSTKYRSRLLIAGVLTGLGLILTGCGTEAYHVVSSTAEQKSPGNYYLQPKVDILLAEQNTGGMFEALDSVKAQMPAFLAELENKGWNFHFTSIPLSGVPFTTKYIKVNGMNLPMISTTPFSQVVTSKHDPNWTDSLWTPPFPGALKSSITDGVSATVFRQPQDFNLFLTSEDVTNSQNGDEQGLATISYSLKNRNGTTGFLRKDALLVVLVVGIGEDTSGVEDCTRPDNVTIPCDATASLDYYQTAFQSLKTNPSQVKFYSAVSAHWGSCLGGQAFPGTRYSKMAARLGGQSYDICTQPVASVFDSLSANLQTIKKGYKTRYLFLQREPDLSSLQVTVYRGGSAGSAEVIAPSAINGWTYAGKLSNVYAIDDPTPMNLSSGYAIELHGTAKLVGDDTASVNFKPAGAQDSASN